jgi:hypothetical protein
MMASWEAAETSTNFSYSPNLLELNFSDLGAKG